MCGITGIAHFKGQPVPADVLARMTASLAHRGPDDYGNALFESSGRAHPWKDGSAPQVEAAIGLGNRRLKIIDLSEAGHQPMPNADRTLWLAYNGEIYNYLELRAELVEKGYTFLSHTDSEVILHAYAEWGADCFRRFNGMWALAIYDTRDGSLILCRDRWGVKPLYVYRDGERLVFGSEIKALFCHPDVPRRPDYSTVYNYVARHYRWVDGSRRTFFDGIEHLPPAHYWKIAPDGRIEESCYWSLNPNHMESPASDEEVLARWRELFIDAVRLRLRSDVPVAAMLSGGLDSSSVTCVAAMLSGTPVTTFSARYDEREFDEGLYIEATVQHIGADGRYIYPRAGELIDTLSEILIYHDEPVCTVTWYAHWMVMKEVAGMGFPVLLNGHAGDELAAGYWDHYLFNFADLERDDPAAYKKEYDRWLANHERDPQEYEKFKIKLEALRRDEIAESEWHASYVNAVTADLHQHAAAPVRDDLYVQHGNLASRLFKEMAYETIPATLRPEDRNSMAFSIETRSPFLDYRLAEFAFALPGRYKIRDGMGKWLTRESMKGILPESVRTRRDKQGFNAPTLHWFREASRDAVRDLLASRSLVEHGLLDQAEVLRVFDEHVGGKGNHYMAIWQWINLELWMEQTFDRVPVV